MCLLICIRSEHKTCKPRFMRVPLYHTVCQGSLTGIVTGTDSPMRARTCIFLVSASRSEKPMLLRQLDEEAAMVQSIRLSDRRRRRSRSGPYSY